MTSLLRLPSTGLAFLLPSSVRQVTCEAKINYIVGSCTSSDTLPETNIVIVPANQWLEDDSYFLLEWPIFRDELLVSGRVLGNLGSKVRDSPYELVMEFHR